MNFRGSLLAVNLNSLARDQEWGGSRLERNHETDPHHPEFIIDVGFGCLQTRAQSSEGDTRLYTKDRLAFQYPSSWTITDKSTSEAQHLLITREGSSVLIMIVALRALVSDGRRLDSTRTGFTQRLIETMSEEVWRVWFS